MEHITKHFSCFFLSRRCTACASNQNLELVCQSEAELAAACASTVTMTTSVTKLSVARRNMGAVVYNSKAYFAGGCVIEGTGSTQFVCDDASDVIDVFELSNHSSADVADSSSAPHVVAAPPLKLAEARGWVAAGAAGGYIVFAGGGTLGTTPHSRCGARFLVVIFKWGGRVPFALLWVLLMVLHLLPPPSSSSSHPLLLLLLISFPADVRKSYVWHRVF